MEAAIDLAAKKMVAVSLLMLLLVVCMGMKHDQGLCASKNSMVPFSGFKVHIQYRWELYHLSVSKQLRLSHCCHGKVVSTTVIPLAHGSNLWNSSFCFVKPIVPTLAIASGTSILDTLGSIVGHKLEQLTKETYFLFAKDVILQADPDKTTLDTTPKHIQCFKMARRKKYAKSTIDVFVPHSYIGGLYACGINSDQLSQTFNPMKLVSPLQIMCNESLSIPMTPLIADDSTKQWVKFTKSLLKPVIVQNIPFLKSPSPFNPLFSASDMPSGKWAAELKVNEDYIYSPMDLYLRTVAMQNIANLVRKISDPPNLMSIRSLLGKNDKKKLRVMYSSYEDLHKSLMWSDSIANDTDILAQVSRVWNLLGDNEDTQSVQNLN